MPSSPTTELNPRLYILRRPLRGSPWSYLVLLPTYAGALLPSFTGEQQNIFPVFHTGSLKQFFLLNNTAAHQPTALFLQPQNTPETYLNQDHQRHLYCRMINILSLNLSLSWFLRLHP